MRVERLFGDEYAGLLSDEEYIIRSGYLRKRNLSLRDSMLRYRGNFLDM